MNIINGWKNSIIDFYYNPPLSGLYKRFELQMCGENGLVESKEDLKTEHFLLNDKHIQELRGWRLTWTLDWSEYANNTLMLQLEEIWQLEKLKIYKMVLFPRADTFRRAFEVYNSGDTFEFGLNGGGGENTFGHDFVVVQFTTVNKVEDLNYIDLDAIQYTFWINHNKLVTLKT